jgi:hypothetical protein
MNDKIQFHRMDFAERNRHCEADSHSAGQKIS